MKYDKAYQITFWMFLCELSDLTLFINGDYTIRTTFQHHILFMVKALFCCVSSWYKISPSVAMNEVVHQCMSVGMHHCWSKCVFNGNERAESLRIIFEDQYSFGAHWPLSTSRQYLLWFCHISMVNWNFPWQITLVLKTSTYLN